MAKLIFRNPTEEQLKHIFRAESELTEADVTFDAGSDLDNGKVAARNWELDWSLKGAKLKEESIMWERNTLTIDNKVDSTGNPTGGTVTGFGLTVRWQEGPLGRPPKTPTGAFVDDVIEAARQRLEFYQKAANGKFACRENAIAITKLEEAMHWLWARRMERELRGVQGEHKP